MSENLLSEVTETTINAMPAGFKMDTLIAQILDNPIPRADTIPYSTDIKSAWRIVEWCIEWADGILGDLFLEYWQDNEWFICNTDLLNRHHDDVIVMKARSDRMDNGELPSFPLAICRYAIKCGLKQGFITEDMVNSDKVIVHCRPEEYQCLGM